MPIDTQTPETAGWYLRILMEQLHDRRVGRFGGRRYRRDTVKPCHVRPGLELLEAYRRGDPPLREDIHSGWAAPFRRYVRMGRLNFAAKLVAPTANRMGLRGFRTAAVNDELGDVAAQELMRRNRLKIVARDVHDYMLGLGDGYALVTPPDPTVKRDWSLITAESPLHAITGHDPATSIAKAGLKVFYDDTEQADFAYLYIPGDVHDAGLHVARLPGQSFFGQHGAFQFSKAWEWDESRSDDLPEGRMPLIRFRNYRGISEFEEHLDHLDRINDKIFNEWWIEKIQAFRQRALERDKDAVDADDYDDLEEGADSELNPSMDPQQIADMFVSSPDALWDLPPGSKLWESTPIDVNPLLNSIQKELQWLAAAADKPLSSLNPDAANQSAEGSANQKEEHLYQVEDRRDRAEAGWSEVIATAFAYQGDPGRADVSKIESIWGPIERFSLEQKAQAASQAGTSLPREAIQRDIWQYEPAEIPNLRTMAGRDLLFQPPGQPPQPRPNQPAAQ